MTLLHLENLIARHGLLTALHGLTLKVAEGEIVAIIGANGAGKTTLMRSIAGAHAAAEGRIHFAGRDITAEPLHLRLRNGIAMSPEGRRLFVDMTVRENLQIAGENGRKGEWTLPAVVAALPQIEPLLGRLAGGLSGGQRQAVAIGRALMANPTLILLDEVSLGLSPAAVEQVYASLSGLKGRMTMIIVEQDLQRALAFSSRIICLAEGRIELDGAPGTLSRDQITQAYFGIEKAEEATDV